MGRGGGGGGEEWDKRDGKNVESQVVAGKLTPRGSWWGGGGVGRESSVQNSLALYWFKAWGSLLPSKSKE